MTPFLWQFAGFAWALNARDRRIEGWVHLLGRLFAKCPSHRWVVRLERGYDDVGMREFHVRRCRWCHLDYTLYQIYQAARPAPAAEEGT